MLLQKAPSLFLGRAVEDHTNFFEGDQPAVDHLVEADDRFTVLAAAEYHCLGTPPLPLVFVSVASKSLRVHVSGLESTLAGTSISVDSKGS